MAKSFTRSVLSCLAAALIAGPALGAAVEAPAFTPNADKNVNDRVADMAALYQWVASYDVQDKDAAIFDVQVPVAELAAMKSAQDDGGPLWVGVHGAVDFSFNPAAKSQIFGTTTLTDGMSVWNGTFRSVGATGVRLQLEKVALPKGAELYVFDRHGQAFGPYTGHHKVLWTNTVMGDEITVQLHLPLGLRSAASGELFQVTELAHMGDNYEFGYNPDKAFCSWNDSCITNASCASIPSAIQPLRDAVAYMIYPVGGSSFICTGGLLNTTTSSGESYFLTANHCLDTQASATGLETYWQWSVGCGASCGSQFNPPGSVARINGATLLATSSNTDFTFLELSGAAPAGSVFLGWTTAAVANSAGTNLFRVSHPAGSPQAYSEQSVNTSAGTCGTLPRGNFIYSDATLADTEGGSSGSPVVNSSNQVVGQLFGACGATPSTTCDNDDRTVDGAFAVTYPSISQWLDPGSGGGGGGGDCPAGYTEYTGSIAAGNPDQVTPTFRDRGSFNGILVCDGADLDLYLDRMRNNGTFRNTVASSTSAGCNEEINYTNNRNRNYRWRVNAYSGSTSYTLCVDPG